MKIDEELFRVPRTMARNGDSCTVDFCYVNVQTGAVSGCACDVPVTCNS